MKNMIISIPASIIVGLLVGKLVLSCLHMPVTAAYMATAVIFSCLLLIRRPTFELVFIGIVALLAEANLRGIGSFRVAEDLLLAIILTVILLPTALNVMGMDNPFGRSASM